MTRDSRSWTAADSWLRRRPLAVDVVIAASLAVIVLPTSLGLIWDSDWHLPSRLALTTVVVLTQFAVALRRVRMRSAFLVVSLAMFVLALAPTLGGQAAAQMGSDFVPILLPCSLMFPVMLYTVAAYGREREPIVALALGLVGAMITTIRLWEPGNLTTGVPAGNAWHLFVFGAMLAVVIAPWALGRFRSVHESYVDTLEEQARRADQDRADEAERATTMERSRIAREMHDVVAHSLSVMVSQAEGGRLAAQRDPAITAPVLATIAATGREVLNEMRGLLSVLGATEASSEDRAPQPALSDLDALVDRVRAAGTPIELAVSGKPGDLGRVGELTAYRVIQEALTNVVKHAGPGARVAIDLTWNDHSLNIGVSDNGPASIPAGAVGHGLTGMRERIELADGVLHVGPDADGGYLVRARIPLAAMTIEELPQ